MKKIHITILCLLLLSLVFNVYALTVGNPDVSPCDNTNRYKNEVAGGGIEMTSDSLKQMVENYRNQHLEDKTEYKTTGFVLSKKIFDEVFKDGSMNALSFDLVVDSGQLNLAIRAIQTTKTEIDTKAGTRLFLGQAFCPTDCSSW